MRAGRYPARRLLVITLVGAAHICLILMLAHRQLYESRDAGVEDISMALILFPRELPRVIERAPQAKVTRVHRVIARQPSAAAIMPTSPVVSENSSGAINWDLEKQRVAGAIVQPPKTSMFDSHPRSQVEEPHHNQPVHHAGESYRDVYGDTVVWISESCYVVSEAPELGIPEAFRRVQPSRTRCIRQGPAEGEMFKDLPEYKKRHPQ